MDYEEMRVLFLYEFKLGFNGAAAARRINEAFGQGTIEQRCIRRWYEKFRRNDFNFESRSNRPNKNKMTKTTTENDVPIDANDTTEILNESLDVNCSFSKMKYAERIFLYEYKMGHTELNAVKNINKAFGPGSVTQKTIKSWFDKYRNEGQYILQGRVDETTPKKSPLKASTIKTSPNKEAASSMDETSSAKKLIAKVSPRIGKAKNLLAPVNKSLAKIQIKMKFFGKRRKDKDRKLLLKS